MYRVPQKFCPSNHCSVPPVALEGNAHMSEGELRLGLLLGLFGVAQ